MTDYQLSLMAKLHLAEHDLDIPISRPGGLLVFTSGNTAEIAELFKEFRTRWPQDTNTGPGFADYKVFIYLHLLHREYFSAQVDGKEELFEMAATFAQDNVGPYDLEKAIWCGALRLQTAEAIAWGKAPGVVDTFLRNWSKRVWTKNIRAQREPSRQTHEIRRHFTHGDLGIRYTHAAPEAKLALRCLKGDTKAAQWLREYFGELDDNTSVEVFRIIDLVTTACDSPAAGRVKEILVELGETAQANNVDLDLYITEYMTLMNKKSMSAIQGTNFGAAHASVMRAVNKNSTSLVTASEARADSGYEKQWVLRDEHQMDFEDSIGDIDTSWGGQTIYNREDRAKLAKYGIRREEVAAYYQAGIRQAETIVKLKQAGVDGDTAVGYAIWGLIQTPQEMISLWQNGVDAPLANDYHHKVLTAGAAEILRLHLGRTTPLMAGKLAGRAWCEEDANLIVERRNAVMQNGAINVVNQVIDKTENLGPLGMRMLKAHPVPRTTLNLVNNNFEARMLLAALDNDSLETVVKMHEVTDKVGMRDFRGYLHLFGTFNDSGWQDVDEVMAATKAMLKARKKWRRVNTAFIFDDFLIDAIRLGPAGLTIVEECPDPQRICAIASKSPRLTKKLNSLDADILKIVATLINDSEEEDASVMRVYNYIKAFT